MELNPLKSKYTTIYQHLKTAAVRNKLILLAMVLPASFYAYYYINSYNNRFHGGSQLPSVIIQIIPFVVGLMMIFLVITIKSFSFLSSKRTDSFKYYFKEELFDCIKKEIPEIKEYIFNQTINHYVFDDSGLFKSRYSDYMGDDAIKGSFGDFNFEMCELHVFNLFNSIFSGVFIVIEKNSGTFKLNCTYDKKPISDFENKNDAKVMISNNEDDMYVAIRKKGRFFEGDNPKEINSVDNDIAMLKDVVGLIKGFAGYKL